jgi:hypothetical protein
MTRRTLWWSAFHLAAAVTGIVAAHALFTAVTG